MNKAEAAKRRQSKPPQTETQAKTLKPISATWQRKPETMPTKKTPPNEKAENLKTCLLKNIKPKTLF
jgi:hypothetical protein